MLMIVHFLVINVCLRVTIALSRHLDFASTGTALSSFIANSRCKQVVQRFLPYPYRLLMGALSCCSYEWFGLHLCCIWMICDALMSTSYCNSPPLALLRLDQTNSLLHLAVDGLPGMQEAHVDVRKKMDEHLKASCQALKYSALHFLLGPLEGFLAKVAAFLGSEIPLYRHDSPAYDQDLELEKEQSE